MDVLLGMFPNIVHFETLGCRLNQIESESAARFFSEAGFSVDMEPLSASGCLLRGVCLCVVNTCTVTGKAEQKARRIIRLLLRRCPDACVLVTGCYAELDSADIASIDSRVCVLPGSHKDSLADVPHLLVDFFSRLNEIPSGGGVGQAIADFLRVFVESLDGTTASAFRLSTDTFFMHSRASIKIQDGCGCSCAYCRIHLARGNPVSLGADDVVERVKQIENRGYHEIVLTGVNLSQYHGSYGDGFVDLAGLLEIILGSTRCIRIRLSSLYPERVDDSLCRILVNERIQPHFHLSVQSGSDRILARMGRSYGSERVLEAVRRLREVKDNPFIACDMIAGFPGETDEDFERTMELCHSAGFSWVHAFPFSARPGTPAFSMRPMVPQAVASQRVKRLAEFAITSKCAYISLWSGKNVSAIAELSRSDRKLSPDSIQNGITHAVTDNFLHVELCGSYPQGTLLTVRIGEPLVSRIRSGDECEASAEVVHEEKEVSGG